MKPLYARLRSKGKRGDVTLGHCTRKLLHLVFAVWQTNRPFNPNHYPWGGQDEFATEEPGAGKEDAVSHKPEQIQPDKDATAATNNVEVNRREVNIPSSNRSIDFTFLREQVTIEQVSRHLGCWEQLGGNSKELRGSCPFHSEPGSKSRSFSVNPNKNAYHCFGKDCNRPGNALDFSAAYHQFTIQQAALHLAETLNLKTNREKRSPYTLMAIVGAAALVLLT